jgi:N-hydroxyarylamine O-acetyltransferase
MVVGMDVAAYFSRIRYDGPVEPTADTLRALHVAHLRAVPFENLSIHLGEPIVLDDRALFEKVVLRRRGGFCYELNGLFAALLRALGFDVAMLSAGVMGAAGEFGPEFDHMSLRVQPADASGPWLADVGFGDCFVEPLPFCAGEVARGRDRWIVADGPTHWLLSRATGDSQPRPQYRFTTRPRRYADYAAMCAFHQTSPESPFTRQRLCTIATNEGRVTLSGLRLATTSGGAKNERAIGEREYAEVLTRHFGIVLPSETGGMGQRRG